jgi:hypothetical protein
VRVDAELVPPSCFIPDAVDLTMVNAAERHRELVAHLATKRTRLCKPKVMCIRGLTPTDKAGLRGNELTMFFVADAPRLVDRKHAFVDAATGIWHAPNDRDDAAALQAGKVRMPRDFAAQAGNARLSPL